MKDILDIPLNYTLVLYDHPLDAALANDIFLDPDRTQSRYSKIEAVYVGQDLHGKHWQGQRPNYIMDCTKIRPINFEWWAKVKKGFDANTKYTGGWVF